MKENKNKLKTNIHFSAIDPVVVSNIIAPTEGKKRNADYVTWGTNNKYPEYLWNLYLNCATLQSIINGTADFIVGNDIVCNVPDFSMQVNTKGDTIIDLVRKIAIDKMIFGGYAIQVVRDRLGRIVELYPLDFMKIRSNEKNTIMYYADDWNAWSVKMLKYPVFNAKDTSASSVLYDKGHITRGVYPIPVYGAATLACETEKNINEFHLNNIHNGFMSNIIINFNNGNPTDEVKKEIEKNLVEKFSGFENAGRFFISYNESDANKTTVERLNSDDFDEKYQALSERTREEIFTAFRANPNLFGLNSDTTGFNTQEFNEAFKLYNRTVVKPIQKEICDSLDKIFSQKDSITITPFSLEAKDDKSIN